MPPAGVRIRQSWRIPSQAWGFPRGKQSARPAQPCAPLVVCLNSESFPPSADSPLGRHFSPFPPHPFGLSKKVCSKPRLRRSRRVSSPRQGNRPSSSTLRCKRGLSAYTSYPFGLSKEKRERPMRRQAPTRAVVCVSIPGLWIFIIRTNSPILWMAEVQKISGIYPAIAFALNKAIEFCYKIGQIVLIRGKSRNSSLFFHHNQCKTAPALA